jgi:hypothetical protein
VSPVRYELNLYILFRKDSVVRSVNIGSIFIRECSNFLIMT